jgi:hypothetical protein
MQVDKQQIVQLLRERGDHGKAQQAEQELPDQVDHEEHSDLLERLGVDPQEVMKKIL